MFRKKNSQSGEIITMIIVITLAPVIIGATYGFVTDSVIYNDEKTGTKVVRTYVDPSEYNIRVYDGQHKNMTHVFKDEAEAKAFAQELARKQGAN